MSIAELAYTPKWYHRGDADEVLFALAYGALALLTISLVEYICAGLLFSNARGILISDGAALVTWSNSSWWEIFKWTTFEIPTRKKERRFCWRALIGVLLRFTVFGIDLVIIGMAVPRGIDVYELDVGSTAMAFSDDPIVYEPVSQLVNSPCRPDPITYEDFTPTATRNICFSTIQAPANNISAQFPSIDLERNDIWVVMNSDGNRALGVIHSNTGEIYTYSHSMRLQDGTQYLLPPLPGIVDEFAERFARFIPTECETFLSNDTGLPAAAVQCPKHSELQGVVLMVQMFSLMKTRPLKKGRPREKVKEFNTPIANNNVKVGSINRPRICIFPALIMFVSFFALAGIVRCTKGKQDYAYKQWRYISQCSGHFNWENPLFSFDQEFEKWDEAVLVRPFQP